MPKTSSIRSSVSIEHRLVTDRHRPMASTADAQHRAVKIGEDRTCSSEDMIADSQTHTEADRRTRLSQYSVPLSGAE